MENPFGTAGMAEGYATARPAVHTRVIEIAAGDGRRFHRALDVGCGAGLSAAPLAGIAEIVIGIEPVEAMLGPARRTSPNTFFAAASGEAIPLRAGSVDLISAAGSLNYLDAGRFFPEAARVLAPGGAALVYDFSTGRSFRDSKALDEWFAEFERRYPWPKGEARELNPEILAGLDRRFKVRERARFEIGLRLDREFYAGYMMTETNVALAIRRGTPSGEIREWCGETLRPVFRGEAREVLFRGYFVWMARAGA